MRDTSQPDSEATAEPGILPSASVPAWQPVLLGAAAGGLGWGIRGQYGHETGAMIAGLLVSLTWMLLLFRHAPAADALRAVAWATVGIGFGGAMTYGQTVGLTHDQALVGNWAALRWGMLGLALKGSVWIGFGGLFLGMGLGGIRYRPLELAALFGGMLGLFFLGTWLLNSPYDPANKILPALYFSDDWRWEPDATLKPRREVWGGLLLALLGAIAYVAVARRDPVARRLAGWAMLGGALGFPAGQSLQAFHAWNLPLFRSGALANVDPLINWWNFMETTFGAVFGTVLGFGLWRNRGLFTVPDHASRRQATAAAGVPPGGLESQRRPAFEPEGSGNNHGAHGMGVSWSKGPGHPPGEEHPAGKSLSLRVFRFFRGCICRFQVEWGLVLLALHTALLVISEFTSIPVLEAYTDLPLVMGALPIIAAAQGDRSSWLIALPITLIPIAGKTLRQLVYEDPTMPPALGWLLYGIMPVGIALAVALRLGQAARASAPAERPLRVSLALATVLYYGLNFAFFRFPYPWSTWTARTPNALIFTACAAALLVLAWRAPRNAPRLNPGLESPEASG